MRVISRSGREVFGKKKKTRKIVNKSFGELEYSNGFWYGMAQITLWNKTFDIRIYPVTNTRWTEITPKQERAYEYFKANICDIQKKIEKIVEYECGTKGVNLERFEPYQMTFTLNGGFALQAFVADGEDDYDDYDVIILPKLGIESEGQYLYDAIHEDYMDDL